MEAAYEPPGGARRLASAHSLLPFIAAAALVWISLVNTAAEEVYSFTTLAGLAGSSGSADGLASAARFNNPYGVAVDSAGNVYVADSGNHTIRRISHAGVVSTLAGLAGSAGSADGTGSTARFVKPSGVAVDSVGNVFVADSDNHTIRKVTPAGVVTTLAGLAGQILPFGADGTGSTARFWSPSGVAVDSADNVYAADQNNHTIRKITPGGVVRTIGGLAGHPGSADGVGGAARFYSPQGIAVDAAGTIYVADVATSTIRKGTLTLPGLPAITAQPQAQTVYPGANVTFTVTAAGIAPFSYQWQKDGANISSATNASYTITNVSSAHAGTYTVVVFNSAGSEASTAALLTVITLPSITTQPQSQTVLVGANFTLNVVAGGAPPLSYQWRKGGASLTDGGRISGATTATLNLANVHPGDAGSYALVVTNAYGSVTSQVANLTVNVPVP